MGKPQLFCRKASQCYFHSSKSLFLSGLKMPLWRPNSRRITPTGLLANSGLRWLLACSSCWETRRLTLDLIVAVRSGPTCSACFWAPIQCPVVRYHIPAPCKTAFGILLLGRDCGRCCGVVLGHVASGTRRRTWAVVLGRSAQLFLRSIVCVPCSGHPICTRSRGGDCDFINVSCGNLYCSGCLGGVLSEELGLRRAGRLRSLHE
jgi:hypothetical protein